MNEELKIKMLQYLTELETATKAGKDFVLANAPETIRQYLEWNLWYNLVIAACFLIATIILCVIYKYWWSFTGSFKDYDQTIFARCIGGFILLLTGGILVGHSIAFGIVSLKVYVAPNVFIFETISELVKK